MQHSTQEISRIFSPLQIGYVADPMEPMNVNTSLDWVFEHAAENPEQEAIPIERDGVVLGVLTREILEKIGSSAWTKFWQKDLDAYIVPTKEVIDATAYISKILENALKHKTYESVWYVVQYRRSYLGIVSLKRILEYTNILRSQDLKRANEIQQHLLKKSMVRDKRFSLCLFNHMAHEIGGDFYRVYQPNRDYILVGCFDVAGKNISAALATMTLGTCFSTFDLFKYSSSPDNITSRINTLIREVNPAGVFVSAVLFYVDFISKQIRIHNCGFSPVLIFVPQENNKIVYKVYNPSFPPLGIEEEYDFSDSQIIPISKGLRLCAYSDGLTDMVNIYGERYEDEQAVKLIKGLHMVPHTAVKKAIAGEIKNWVGTASLADDVTLMDMRFN